MWWGFFLILGAGLGHLLSRAAQRRTRPSPPAPNSSVSFRCTANTYQPRITLPIAIDKGSGASEFDGRTQIEFIVDTGTAYTTMPAYKIRDFGIYTGSGIGLPPKSIRFGNGAEVTTFGWKSIRIRIGADVIVLPCAVLGPESNEEEQGVSQEEQKRFREVQPLLGRVGLLETYTLHLNATGGRLSSGDDDADMWLSRERVRRGETEAD